MEYVVKVSDHGLSIAYVVLQANGVVGHTPSMKFATKMTFVEAWTVRYILSVNDLREYYIEEAHDEPPSR